MLQTKFLAANRIEYLKKDLYMVFEAKLLSVLL